MCREVSSREATEAVESEAAEVITERQRVLG
jgi:hypothetical protein